MSLKMEIGLLSLVVVEETEEDLLRRYIDSTYEAWRQWEMHSCVERHGGHPWIAELEHPEDCSGVGVYCSYCPATIDDVFPDATDSLYGKLGSITVENGKHDCDDPRLPFEVPINLHVEVFRYTSMNSIYPEVDIEITLSPRQ